MLNEVKTRGLGVALAAVKRSENAADERDEVGQLKKTRYLARCRSGCRNGILAFIARKGEVFCCGGRLGLLIVA